MDMEIKQEVIMDDDPMMGISATVVKVERRYQHFEY